MNLWPHQEYAEKEVLRLMDQGERRICVTCPTGGGKSVIMQLLLPHFLKRGMRVSLYSNRKMLIEQLSRVCLEAGWDHGVRAAGHDDEREHLFQISSLQTEHARVTKSKRWKMHQAKLVIVDEAHLMKEQMACGLLDRHISEDNATVVGFTATPLGIGHVYDRLVVAGKVSDMFRCGALVPAVHFGPDEPDLRKMQGLIDGKELTGKQQSSAMVRPGLTGRIINWFNILNPERRATICFGPDVETSIGIAKEFSRNGIAAAHIDGEHCWIDGELRRSNESGLRQQILNGSKDGSIQVLCNRFVLREGIDCPWLSHAIFCCVFGSLQSYLQSGGRILRGFRDLRQVTIQDHGGNWWRHGSLNEDREWDLQYDERIAYGIRADRLRENPEKQPFSCPKCGRIWAGGTRCAQAKGGCGAELPITKRTRTLVTIDGELVRHEHHPFQPRKPYNGPDGQELWMRMYFRAKSKRWNASFRQAFAMYEYENGGWPDKSWPYMPIDNLTSYHKVRDVPLGLLVSPRAENGQQRELDP